MTRRLGRAAECRAIAHAIEASTRSRDRGTRSSIIAASPTPAPLSTAPSRAGPANRWRRRLTPRSATHRSRRTRPRPGSNASRGRSVARAIADQGRGPRDLHPGVAAGRHDGLEARVPHPEPLHRLRRHVARPRCVQPQRRDHARPSRDRVRGRGRGRRRARHVAAAIAPLRGPVRSIAKGLRRCPPSCGSPPR